MSHGQLPKGFIPDQQEPKLPKGFVLDELPPIKKKETGSLLSEAFSKIRIGASASSGSDFIENANLNPKQKTTNRLPQQPKDEKIGLTKTGKTVDGIPTVTIDEEKVNLTNAITQTNFKKNERPFDQTKEEAIKVSTKKLNDIMFGEGDEWKDPIKTAVKGIQKSTTTKEAAEHLGVKNLTEMSLASDGFEAKKTLATTILGQQGNDNLTSEMLRGKEAEYDKVAQPFRDLGDVNYNDERDFGTRWDIYNAAIRAYANKNPGFKKQAEAAGLDFNTDNLLLSLGDKDTKVGQIVATVFGDKDFNAFIQKENPALLPSIAKISDDLIYDNKDYGKVQLANEISKEVQNSGYNNIDPVFNFEGGVKKMGDIVATGLYQGDPKKIQFYNEHKDEILDMLDAPSFFERFSGRGKEFGQGLVNTFTEPFTTVSETLKDNWDKEASHVSADPKGLSKFISDVGGAAGLVSSIVATGNLTGIANPQTAGMVATGLGFFGDQLEQGKIKFPDSPIKAWTSAALNTTMYIALSTNITKGKNPFSKVKTQIDNVVENLATGNITREVARRELNTIGKKAIDFTAGTLGKQAKISAELSALTLINKGFDKVAGMSDDEFEKYHPDDEIAKTFSQTFWEFLPITAVGKAGAMRKGNKIVEESLYEAATNPKRFERVIDELAIKDPSVNAEEMKANLKFMQTTLEGLKGIDPKNQKRFLWEAMKEKAMGEKPIEPSMAKVHNESVKEVQEIKERILAGEDADTIVTEKEQKEIDEKDKNDTEFERLTKAKELDQKEYDGKRAELDGRRPEDRIKIEKLEQSQKEKNEDYEKKLLKLTPPEQLTAEQEVIRKALDGKEIKDDIYRGIAEAALKDPETASQFIEEARSQATGQQSPEFGNAASGIEKTWGKTISDHVSPKEKVLTEKDVTKAADEAKIEWDNDPAFMDKSFELTGERELSKMGQQQLGKMMEYVKGQAAATPPSVSRGEGEMKDELLGEDAAKVRHDNIVSKGTLFRGVEFGNPDAVDYMFLSENPGVASMYARGNDYGGKLIEKKSGKYSETSKIVSYSLDKNAKVLDATTLDGYNELMDYIGKKKVTELEWSQRTHTANWVIEGGDISNTAKGLDAEAKMRKDRAEKVKEKWDVIKSDETDRDYGTTTVEAKTYIILNKEVVKREKLGFKKDPPPEQPNTVSPEAKAETNEKQVIEEGVEPLKQEQTTEEQRVMGQAKEGQPPTGEGTGEPPKPPKEAETGENESEGGITHAANEIRRKDRLLPEYEKTPQTFEQWNNDAEKAIKEGYDVEKLMDKIEAGHDPTPVENAIRKIYIATLDAEIAKDPTDALLAKQKRFIEIGDLANSRAGRNLVSLKGENSPLSSISDFYVAKMEAAGVDKLTETQKKETKEAFDKVQKADENATAAMEAYREEIAKLKAENELLKQKKTPTKKGDWGQQRKDAVAGAREALKKIRTGESGVGVSLPVLRELIAIAPHVKKYVGALLGEGVHNLKEVVAKAYEEFKDILEGITEKDIHNILAGEYNEVKPTRNELAAKMRDLKDEAYYINKLERLLNGTEPKNENKRIARNREIAELQEKIRDFRKAEREAAKPPKEEKTPKEEVDSDLKKLEALKKRNETETAKIKERIAKGDFETKKKVPFLEDPEMQKKFPAQYKATLDAVIKREEARHEFDIALLRDQMARRTKTEIASDLLAKTAGTAKAIVTGIDDSAVAIQTYMSLLRRPRTGATALRLHIAHAFSQKKFNRWLAALHNSSDWKFMKDAGLDVTEPQSLKEREKEEIFNNRFSGTIKVNGKEYKLIDAPLKPFERAFTTLGNVTRVVGFRTIAAKYMREGNTWKNNPELFKSLAKRLNTETGRGQLNEYVENASRVVTLGIWSPRLMAMKFNILGISDIASLFVPGTKGYYRQLHPRERLAAIRDVAQFAVTVMALSYGVALAFGGEIDLDPLSPTFMDVKFKNGKSINFTGGFSGYIRAIAQFATGKRTQDGETKKVGRLETAGRFFRGKTPPLTGSVWNLAAGKDYMGKPTTFVGELKNALTPISVKQISTQIERDGAKSFFTQGIPTFFGFNVKDDRDYAKAEEITKEDAEKYGTFKEFSEKGLNFPEFDPAKIQTKEVNGKVTEHLSDYPKEVQDKFISTKKGYFNEELKSLKNGEYQVYRDNDGTVHIESDNVDVSEMKYVPFKDLTKEDIQYLSGTYFSGNATKKTKEDVILNKK